MDSFIYLGDYKKYIEELWGQYDAVITDPPYDISLDESEFCCDGNRLFFCKPENQFFHYADEYLFWIKTPSTKNFQRKCGRFVEMILVLRGFNAPFNVLHWSQMTGVYDDRLIYPPVHPYEKPLSLMERIVNIYTNPGDIVLDPFMGSGTTGVACQNLGRGFIGIEKDPKYFKLAEGRIDWDIRER